MRCFRSCHAMMYIIPGHTLHKNRVYHNMKKVYSILVVLTMMGMNHLVAQSIYSNTSSALFYSPAYISAGTGLPVIYLDDVNIPSSVMGATDSLDVTGITYGFGKYGRQIPLWVDFYYTQVDPAATSLNNICLVPPVHFDSLFAYGRAVFGNLYKTFGDSVHTLFTVKTTKDILKKKYNTFFVGISFSISSDSMMGYTHGPLYTTNGTSQKANNASAWNYDGARTTRLNKVNGQPAAFYLIVWGRPKGSAMQPVPLFATQPIEREELKLNVYPNPVSANTQLQFTLKENAKVRIEVYSPTGLREFANDKNMLLAGNNNIRLNLSALSKGVHMLKLYAAGKVYTKLIYR